MQLMQIIKFRMDQSALKFYCTVEDAVPSTANWQLAASDLDAHLTTICEHFKEVLDRNRLQTNFAILLPELMDGKTAETPINTVLTHFLLLVQQRDCTVSLSKLVVLMLVMPATSATG
jgi:hypothetical protein